MFLRLGLILGIFISTLPAATPFQVHTTPSKVYDKIMYLHDETHLIKEHFGIEGEPKFINIKSHLLLRHVWQRTYELFVKMNILRQKYNLPIIEPVNMEPTLNMDASFIYEQILRLLQEVRILKLHLGVSREVETIAQKYVNKSPTDLYNILNKISRDFDIINAQEVTPSYVFGELIRIYEDFQAIFNRLKLDDETTPPSKNTQATPMESYRIALELLNVLSKIENNLGLKSIDFYAFRREEVVPSDVFEITQIILAELQVIKAKIGLTHTITRGAKQYRDKTPTDASQMLGWLLKKSQKLLHTQTMR